MNRKLIRLGVLVLSLACAGQALAFDPSAAQAYCNAVKQAAADAQKNYVNVYTPQRDPQQTFMDATNSCMSAIGNFTIAVPPNLQAMQPIIQKVSQQLLLQACDAAKQEFQQSVNRALSAVNSNVNDIGLDVGLNNGQIRVTGNGSNPIGTVINNVNGPQGIGVRY